ncbi:MAG: metallophosphoesterase [Thermoleophilaceae bacterium]
MRTLVVSDLHLGSSSDRDVLRLSGPRAALLAAVERAERLILLGDVLELRGLSARDAVERSRAALGEIGAAAGDAPVVLLPGNHDHRFAAEWIDGRRSRGGSELALEQVWRPGRSGLAAKVARALGASELTLAYPGVWLRPDVYATHGHYLDCHNAVPALEPLAAAVTARLAGGLPTGRLGADAYEAALAPLYAFIHELSQRRPPPRAPEGPGASLRLWQRLNSGNGGLDLTRLFLGRLVIPGAVAGVNRAGLGRFSADLSPASLRRAALQAMGTVVARLGVEAEHVIFGHTHRAGPLATDDPADGWERDGGGRLWNSGSWVLEPELIGTIGVRSGHWPGACLVLEEDGPPRLERLLDTTASFALTA